MSKEKENKEVTLYRFTSEIRGFLDRLIKHPITAKPSKFMRDLDFGKDRLIKILMKKNILERHESIKDSTNSDEKKAKYVVKYKVKKQNFEDKVEELYKEHIKKESINESETSDSSGQFSTQVFPIINRPFYKMKNNKSKKVYITEAQFRYIQENILSNTAGDEFLMEDGEGGAIGGDGGADYGSAVGATNASQSGEVIRSKGGNRAGGLALNSNDPAYSRRGPLSTNKM